MDTSHVAMLCLTAVVSFGCQPTQDGAAPAAPDTPPPVTTAAPTTDPTVAPPPVDEPPPAPPADNIVTMSVKDKLFECTGSEPMKCMMVRIGDAKEFTYFYSNVEGFTFEEGFTYELKVEVTDVDNPPADASSKRYRLIEVVSKTKVK